MRLTKKVIESIAISNEAKAREIGKDSFRKEMSYTVDTPNTKLEEHYSEITTKCTKRLIELMNVSIGDTLTIKSKHGTPIKRTFIIQSIDNVSITFTNGLMLDVLFMNLDCQADKYTTLYAEYQEVTISKELPQLSLRGTNFMYKKVYDTFLWSSHNDIKNDREYSIIACLIDSLVASIDSVFFNSFVESYTRTLTTDYYFSQDEFDQIIDYANIMHKLLNRGTKLWTTMH